MNNINLLPTPDTPRWLTVLKYAALGSLLVTALVLLGAWFLLGSRIRPQHVSEPDVTLSFQTVNTEIDSACQDFESPRLEARRVTVCLGQRPTGGYYVAVNKIVDAGEHILVHATEIQPDGCIVSQATTSPAVTVELDQPPVKTVKVNLIVRKSSDCTAPEPVGQDSLLTEPAEGRPAGPQ